MFKRLDGDRAPGALALTIYFEGQEIAARSGETVACALLAAGIVRFRKSAISGTERGPYCLMGACFDCLVSIDGAANQQACLRVVRNGMRIACQDGPVAVNGAASGARGTTP
jgi:predicted molibdopterin-dependent oxidoreductase YjgC